MTLQEAETANIEDLKREAILCYTFGDKYGKVHGYKLWEIYKRRTN